ncbi:hypothetical protein CAEBREN_02876 [Caenorhabditis brenneri]|uniref:Uncharacterized protein n=1 Tax=Caenorhabditis brenneri TaxID=135651 RepID=G0NL25_CAEBE|nr:hypothetical protein CAEBREN_02876 [Caenorhabditis brenneri]
MFLIAKIVRGRRLLHELEKQEKDEHLAADAAAAQSNSQGNHRNNESSPNGDDRGGDPSQFRPKRRYFALLFVFSILERSPPNFQFFPQFSFVIQSMPASSLLKPIPFFSLSAAPIAHN